MKPSKYQRKKMSSSKRKSAQRREKRDKNDIMNKRCHTASQQVSPQSRMEYNYRTRRDSSTLPVRTCLQSTHSGETRREGEVGVEGGCTRILSEVIIRITAFRASKPSIAKVREKGHAVRRARSRRKREISVLRKRRNGIRPGIPEEQVILPPR